jgi:hypothetical protein
MMDPLFTADLSKFSRQSLDPAMPFPVLPGIISRHAHECGDFFHCRLLLSQSANFFLPLLHGCVVFCLLDVGHTDGTPEQLEGFFPASCGVGQ